MTASGDRSQQVPAIERTHGQPMQHWFDLLAELGDAGYGEQMALLQAMVRARLTELDPAA